MRRTAAAAFCALCALPAWAGDAPAVVLYLENGASRAIEQLALFPVNKAGAVVDDVLLARHEPIGPGQSAALVTGLRRCAKVSLWSRFADGEEVSAVIDLCTGNRLVAHD